MNVKELLTKPVTVATSVGIAIAHALGVAWVDPFISVVLANISTIFTALSISGFTLAPEVAWLPQETLTTLALVAGGLYVLRLVDRVIDQLATQLEEDDTN
jgi:hypothetical protein